MATIPPRLNEVLEEQNNRVRIIANTGPMRYKTGGVFAGLLVEAMVGDDRVGYLTAEKRGSTYVMDGVYVEPEYRQNGIATDMVRKAHETVPMTPYILTENQVYQSEIGKKIAINEYRMVTASTIVTAGPLLAVPELLGAGEAIAGAGESAAGAEEAGGMGSMMKNMPSMGGGSSNQQSDNSNDINNQPSTSSQDFASPANPVMGSIMPLETHPLTPTKPFEELLEEKSAALKLPGETQTKSGLIVSGEEQKRQDKEDEEKAEEPVKEPKEVGSSGDAGPLDALKKLDMSVDVPRVTLQSPTPANPVMGNKLFNLIQEDMLQVARRNDEFGFIEPKRPSPSTTWE